eukprot:CAMPEP_0178420038 /NCGR_PEP_ID=MMETSP0689_2-20121128/25923_1 /TAXON_ID=160604 /ORGANISM="Amphidinium massartii, Strain CS-259" /LENGTH=555 /DNA_ID=CAMNT_0020041501 /DNA_START=49 /DNA_END=1713 /DNA_ORIENTATION=-
MSMPKWDGLFSRVATGSSNFTVEHHFNSGAVLAHALQAGIAVMLYVSPDEGFQKHVLHVDQRLRRLSASPDLSNPILSINQTISFPVHHISTLLSGSPAVSYCLQHGVSDPMLSSKTALVVLPAAQFTEQDKGLSPFSPRATQRGNAARSRGPTEYANRTVNSMMMIVPAGRLRLKRCLEAVIEIAPGAITSQEQAARIIQLHRRALSLHRAIQLQTIDIADPAPLLTGNPDVDLKLNFLPATQATVRVRLNFRRNCDAEAERVRHDYGLVAADEAQLAVQMKELLALRKWLLDLVPDVFQADGLRRLLLDHKTLDCVMLVDAAFLDAVERTRREVGVLAQTREMEEGVELNAARAAVLALENMFLLEEEYAEVAQRLQLAGGLDRPPVVDLEGKIRNLGPALDLNLERPPLVPAHLAAPAVPMIALPGTSREMASRDNTRESSDPTNPFPPALVQSGLRPSPRGPTGAYGQRDPQPAGDTVEVRRRSKSRVSIHPDAKGDGGPRASNRIQPLPVPFGSPGISPRSPGLLPKPRNGEVTESEPTDEMKRRGKVAR